MSKLSTAAASPELDARAVYLSPSGRACRWLMTTFPPGKPPEAYLAYSRPDGGEAVSKMPEGFVLTKCNWRLLRRLA